MSNASSTNNSPSGTAFPNVPVRLQSESAFLDQQASAAVAAMQQTLQDMQQSAKAVVDIHWWTQHRPWVTVGAATLGGFIAASLLPRGGSQQTAGKDAQPAQSSWLSSLLVFGLGAVRGAAVSAVTSALTSTLMVDQKVDDRVQEAQEDNFSSAASSE